MSDKWHVIELNKVCSMKWKMCRTNETNMYLLKTHNIAINITPTNFFSLKAVDFIDSKLLVPLPFSNVLCVRFLLLSTAITCHPIHIGEKRLQTI